MSLTILGLSADEVDVYRALALVQSASSTELSEMLGRSVEDVGRHVDRLLVRHLVVSRDDGRVAAVRPAVALGAAVAEQHRDLRAAEGLLADLDDCFRATRQALDPEVVLDVVRGADELAARLRQLQAGARREVLSLVKAPVTVVGSVENDAEDAAVNQGVGYRVVLERAMLEEEPHLVQEIHRAREAGEEIRVAASVPTKLLIIDRSMALVPLGLGGAPFESAILIGASGLLDALVALFETIWAGARELTVGPYGPDDDRARLLTMLLAGLTDEAIARDFGVSARTLQRRIRDLLDLAGVETRLQLGYVAGERGWIPGAGWRGSGRTAESAE